MSAAQAGQGGLVGAVAVAIVPPASTPPLLIEAYKSNLLQIPRYIVLNIALNGYSTLADLAYFGQKDFKYFCSANIRQDLNRGGA